MQSTKEEYYYPLAENQGILPTNDGGYLLYASNILVKFDSLHQLEWEKGTSMELFTIIESDQTDGYYYVFQTRAFLLCIFATAPKGLFRVA